MRCLVPLIFFAATLAAAQSPSDQLFTSAVDAQQHGDYDTAIRDYEKLLQARPNMGEAHANLGAALAHNGRFDEAITQYKLALPNAPDKDGVRLNLGLAYYKKGDLASAAPEFETLQKLRPRDPQLAILLGDTDVRLGRAPAALAMLTPLEAENASNPDFEYVFGEAQIASGARREGATRMATLARSTQNADAYFLAGVTFLELNEIASARINLEAALKLNPELPNIDTLVGQARDRSGDQPAAEQAFREAIRRNPDDFDANLTLGGILYKRRDIDGAKPFLDKALQLKPTDAMARYESAMWASTSHEYEQAAQLLESVEKTDPTWLEPHVELATVYYRLHRPEDGARERAIVDKLTAQQQSKGPGVP